MESYPQHIVDKEAKTGDKCIRCNKLLTSCGERALFEIHPGMDVAGRFAGEWKSAVGRLQLAYMR
jgi:hypothetical protein